MVHEARKALGLSLADVAAMTRIPKTMLKHLESDRYDEYSAEVFARGHLRNYAREVDLEPEVVLQAFDRHTGRRGPEDVSEDAVARGGGGGEVSFDFDFGSLRETVQPSHLVAVGLVLVALFVVFGVLTGKRATAQDPNQFPETQNATTQGDWELEEESDKSRWLLDQPSTGEESGD